MREPRVGEPVRQAAVVGQEKQAFAIVIEPAGRVDVGDWNQRRERRPARRVAELTEHAVGFVECDRCGSVLTPEGPAFCIGVPDSICDDGKQRTMGSQPCLQCPRPGSRAKQ